MLFKSPRQKELTVNEKQVLCKINIGNRSLKEVEDIKFLGVIIDHKMSWDKHIRIITNKVRNSIAQLYEMRKLIPPNLKNSVYNDI